MDFKKSMIILIMAIFFISIAGVCAADANDTAIASEDANQMDLSSNDVIAEDNLKTSEENTTLAQANDDENLSAESFSEILSEAEGTYYDLRDEIGNGGDKNLAKSYYRYNGGDTIEITTSGVINGNGAVIDMANSGHRAFYVTAAGVTIKNLTIKNANYDAGPGGAICFSNSGTVTNCNFIDNQATDSGSWGGAIIIGGTGTVSNCNFTDNSATRYGGAVWIGSGTVTNCNFVDNKATGDYSYGGAVFFLKTGDVTNCNFTNNSARYGGAIEFDGAGTVTNCNFTNNSASDRGGAVYFLDTGDVTNCTFTNNSARYGGAIEFDGAGTVTNCNFTGNTATWAGAVYFLNNGDVTNCNFTDNTASSEGGAIRFSNSGTVTNCNFANNNASSEGGAISFNNDGTLTNCNFTDNSASRGGAIYFIVSTGSVINCNFTDNSASWGGAIYFSVSTCSVSNCNFANNNASSAGGAVYFDEFSIVGSVVNCNFTDNSASWGGAVYFNEFSVGSVSNCNFAGNKAGFGGAIYFGFESTVTNCNFTGNNATTGSAIYFNFTMRPNTVSNSIFLNNRANAEAFEVTKNDNNIIIIFTGNDNLLNAIYSKGDVSFTNVTYWGANGITNTDDNYPSRFNKEAGQNITIKGFINGIILNTVYTTDAEGKIVLENVVDYWIVVRHDGDSYYTEAETKISNLYVNVTSISTNNRTVNITAKSNIPQDIVEGKLLFILLNTNSIAANYAGNGIWWAVHTFDDYAVYEVNATYIGLDNVTINNATITINKANSTLTVGDIEFDYNSSGSTTISYDGATGVNASVVDQPNAVVKVVGNTITVSGLNAGTYNLTVTTIADTDHNNVTKTSTITVNKINSTLTIGDIVFDYNSTGSGSLSFTGASGVNASVVDQPNAVVKVNTDSITVSGLNAGNYTLTVTTITDANHNNVTKTANITVNKVDSTLTVDNIVFDYNKTGSATVSFTNASGVNASVVDHKEAVVNVDGNTITVSGLNAGNYTLTVTTIADANHNNVTKTANITVNKIDSTLTVGNVVLDYGESVNVTVTAEGAEGITAKIGSDNVTVNGYTIPISGLNASTYNLTVTTVPDSNHNPVNKTVTITVNKIDSTLTVGNVVLDYGKTTNVTVITEGATGVTAKIDNDDAVVNGNVISIPFLDVGNYTLTVTTIADANHNNVTKTANITVNKVDSTLTVDNIVFDYNSTGSATVSYDGASGVNASVIDQPNAKVNVNGNTITVSNLNAGNYTLTVTTIADANHNNITKTAKITVNKLKTELKASAISTTYNINRDLTITLKDSNGNPVAGVYVSVDLNGAKIYVTDKNGRIKLNVAKLVPKTYTAKITFKGNGNYLASSKEIKVTVKKATPKLTAKNKKFKKSVKVKKYTVTLKDNTGKAMKKVQLTIKVGKKTFKAKTNNKGKATFKIKKLSKKGKYKATVTYKGNKNYNKVTKKVKITIK